MFGRPHFPKIRLALRQEFLLGRAVLYGDLLAELGTQSLLLHRASKSPLVIGYDWFDGTPEEIKSAIERQWRTACDATRRRNSAALLACVLGANFVAARKLDRSHK